MKRKNKWVPKTCDSYAFRPCARGTHVGVQQAFRCVNWDTIQPEEIFRDFLHSQGLEPAQSSPVGEGAQVDSIMKNGEGVSMCLHWLLSLIYVSVIFCTTPNVVVVADQASARPKRKESIRPRLPCQERGIAELTAKVLRETLPQTSFA